MRQPLHDGKCFEPQTKVDDFVANYPKSSYQQTAVCINQWCEQLIIM